MNRLVRITAGGGTRWRRIVESTIGALVALALAATWQMQSFVVCGPSMAETLRGPHRQLACPDCGYEFRCATDEPVMPGKLAVCPNCGDSQQRLDTAPEFAADRVLIDKRAFLFSPPRRWELAAFHAPDQTSQIYVKRVVGLPGEAIELRHGDLYADGVIQRKRLAELSALAVVVHDSSHQASMLGSRWRPDEPQSDWRQNGLYFLWSSGIRKNSGATHNDAPSSHEVGYVGPIDWLTYHHLRRRPGMPDMKDEAPITDDCGYNQTRPVTASHSLRDILVRCRMTVSPPGQVFWLLTDGISQFLISIDLDDYTLSVTQDGRHISGTVLPPELATHDLDFEAALCDQQVLLALGGREILAVPYNIPADAPFRPTSRPVAVGTQGAGLKIGNLVLLRDVYYLAGRDGSGGVFQDRLGDDEYFVLGDNSPISLDSRDWSRGVQGDDFIGKPVAAYQFQVPDFLRFRYIH